MLPGPSVVCRKAKVSLPVPPVMTWLPELPTRCRCRRRRSSVSVPLVAMMMSSPPVPFSTVGRGRVVDHGRGRRVAAGRDAVRRGVGERTARRRIVAEEDEADRTGPRLPPELETTLLANEMVDRVRIGVVGASIQAGMPIDAARARRR